VNSYEDDFVANLDLWRECEGVEPSAHTEGRTPTELKSARPTGTHPLPHHATQLQKVKAVL